MRIHFQPLRRTNRRAPKALRASDGGGGGGLPEAETSLTNVCVFKLALESRSTTRHWPRSSPESGRHRESSVAPPPTRPDGVPTTARWSPAGPPAHRLTGPSLSNCESNVCLFFLITSRAAQVGSHLRNAIFSIRPGNLGWRTALRSSPGNQHIPNILRAY